MRVEKFGVTATAVSITVVSAYLSATGGFDFGANFGVSIGYTIGGFMVLSEAVILTYPLSVISGKQVGNTLLMVSKILSHTASILALTYGIYSGVAGGAESYKLLIQKEQVLNQELIVLNQSIKNGNSSLKNSQADLKGLTTDLLNLESNLSIMQSKPLKKSTVWQHTKQCTDSKWASTCKNIKKTLAKISLKKALIANVNTKGINPDLKNRKIVLKNELEMIQAERIKNSKIANIIPEGMGVITFGLLLGLLFGLTVEVMKSASIFSMWRMWVKSKPKAKIINKITKPNEFDGDAKTTDNFAPFRSVSTRFAPFRSVSTDSIKNQQVTASRFDNSENRNKNESRFDDNSENRNKNGSRFGDNSENTETRMDVVSIISETETRMDLNSETTETAKVKVESVNLNSISDLTSPLINSLMPELSMDIERHKNIIEGITLLLRETAAENDASKFQPFKLIKSIRAGIKGTGFLTNHFFNTKLKVKLIELKLISLKGKSYYWISLKELNILLNAVKQQPKEEV